MKAFLALTALITLVAAAPAPATQCFVRREDGLYERSTQCHYKRGQLDTDACLVRREDGLYERGHYGCGYYGKRDEE